MKMDVTLFVKVSFYHFTFIFSNHENWTFILSENPVLYSKALLFVCRAPTTISKFTENWVTALPVNES